MAEKITFQTQDGGYAPQEVDAFVDLILENYEELLAHYQTQQTELEKLTTELSAVNEQMQAAKDASATPTDAPDYNAEALELLNETSKVIAQVRSQARAKITALIDQSALHAYRLEDSAKNMRAELDKMYATLDEQL